MDSAKHLAGEKNQGKLKNTKILTKKFSSHTLMERSFPTQFNKIFNLSMSVCDEKFFVKINIYHSDERDSSITA